VQSIRNPSNFSIDRSTRYGGVKSLMLPLVAFLVLPAFLYLGIPLLCYSPPLPPEAYKFKIGQKVVILEISVKAEILKRWTADDVNKYFLRFFDKNWNLRYETFRETDLKAYVPTPTDTMLAPGGGVLLRRDRQLEAVD
jgi:hypothetical protein